MQLVDPTHRRLFALSIAVGVALLLCGRGHLWAAEPAGRDLLPTNAILVVEVNQPVKLLRHPLIRQVVADLSRSEEVRRRLASDEMEPLRQMRTFLEQSLGVGWQKGVGRLTAGGVAFAVTTSPKPTVLIVMTADRPDTLKTLTTAFRRELTRRGVNIPSKTYRSEVGYKVGDAWYTVIGRRMLISSDGEQLKGMVDRLLDWKPAAQPKRSASADLVPTLRARLDLTALRKLPQLAEPLKIPSKNAGLLTAIGGYIDLIRRGTSATVELRAAGETIDLHLSIAAGSHQVTPGLEGYFVTADNQRAAPLLKIPGTIYSASWYRDYAALWNSRNKLVPPAVVKRLEKRNDEIRQQFSVFGGQAAPATTVRSMGSHFRLVVARQQESLYRIPMPNRLPAGAFVFDLRDEAAFRVQALPLLRGIGLIASFGKAKALSKTSRYKGAVLTTIRFRDDPAAVRTGDRFRYNFSPTYSITRRHLILGSTREIVRDVIDQLNRSPAAEELSPQTTELQYLSGAELAGALQDSSEAIIRGFVLNSGLSLDEASDELGHLVRVLKTLGGVSVRSSFGAEKFEVRLRLHGRTERRSR